MTIIPKTVQEIGGGTAIAIAYKRHRNVGYFSIVLCFIDHQYMVATLEKFSVLSSDCAN